MRHVAVIAAAWVLAACVVQTARPPRAARTRDPAGGPQPSTLDPGRRRNLLRIMPTVAAYVDDQAREHEFPAVVVGVIAGGELVWSHAYGPADEDTVFRIGSITKTLTGAAVLHLRDTGVLSLDDPAERYVPELKRLRYPTTDSPRITIRHLLTHTSGIGGNTGVDYWRRPNHALTERELFAVLDGFALEDVPGTRTVYSNIGVGLAGIVVARASGVPFRDYVDREILNPLGMTHTVWDREDVPIDQLAPGNRRIRGEHVREHHWRLGAVEGMGGLYSSLRDLARFAAWQLAAWPPRDDVDEGPIARASVRESHLIAGPVRPAGKGWGIGWQVRHDDDVGHVVSHVGGTFQYAAALWLLPERDLGLILLCNDGYGLDKVDHIARNALWIVALREPR